MNTKKTIVVAEAGVNHNGHRQMAIELIDAAKESGADIVKFQTFKAKNLATEDAILAEYQKTNSVANESQREMLSRLEMSVEDHHALLEHCSKVGIEFLSTAFDSDSLRLLNDTLSLERLKIPSGEITNAPLLLEFGATGKDLILSTGMATLAEIEEALTVIAFGMIPKTNRVEPSMEAFQQAYLSDIGQRFLADSVTLLHCTTEYPAPITEINLRAMDTMRNAFHLPVGYSDHSKGIYIPIAAVARGASIIEKHFTLNRELEGPDHRASLEPDELLEMINGIRQIENSLGIGIKGPQPSELRNRTVARKSIVAAKDIRRGDVLTTELLTTKRPGNGLKPNRLWDLIGKPSARDYLKNEQID